MHVERTEFFFGGHAADFAKAKSVNFVPGTDSISKKKKKKRNGMKVPGTHLPQFPLFLNLFTSTTLVRSPVCGIKKSMRVSCLATKKQRTPGEAKWEPEIATHSCGT